MLNEKSFISIKRKISFEADKTSLEFLREQANTELRKIIRRIETFLKENIAISKDPKA